MVFHSSSAALRSSLISALTPRVPRLEAALGLGLGLDAAALAAEAADAAEGARDGHGDAHSESGTRPHSIANSESGTRPHNVSHYAYATGRGVLSAMCCGGGHRL